MVSFLHATVPQNHPWKWPRPRHSIVILLETKKRAQAVSEEELIPYALIDTLASKCKHCSWRSAEANGLICENEHRTTDF